MTPQPDQDTSRSRRDDYMYSVWDAERQRAPAKHRRSCPTELIAASQLARFLGGESGVPHADLGDSQEAMLGVRLDLDPGDGLFMQGSVGHYAYVIESGLIQCHRQHDGLGLPLTVTYVGQQEWIGLHDFVGRREESANAVARTSLLALPVSELHALSASSPEMTELLAGQISSALKRDLRVFSGLCDLPPDLRTVVGLVYLASLIDPQFEKNHSDAPMKVVIDVEMLGYWLGVPSCDLHQHLLKLQGDGGLCLDERHITGLWPQGLVNAFLAMRHPSQGRHVDEPALLKSVRACAEGRAS